MRPHHSDTAPESGAGCPAPTDAPPANPLVPDVGIGLLPLLVRILAVIAVSETVEASLNAVVEIDAWVGDILFDVLVMFTIAAPLLYFAAIRPLAQRFAAHAALAHTALEQGAALKASRERLALAEYAETVVASVPVGLAVLTTDLVVLSANRALRDMFSLTDRDLIGQPLEKVLPGVNPWRLVAEVLGSDQPSPTISVDVSEADGIRHLHVRLTRVRQGGDLRLLAVVEDITTRIRLQEQLHAERTRFWGILDAASDAIISVDEAHRIIVFNQQAEHVFGYSEGEAIGQPLGLLLPSRFRADHDDHMRAFRREAVSRRPMAERPVLTARRKNGEEFPVEITISKIDLLGHTVLTAIVRDVTERERAERELRESREALQDFLDTASDLIQNSTPDGRFTYVNRAWLETLGYRAEDLPSLTVLSVVHPDEQASWQNVLRRVMAGESLRQVEVAFVRKDGRPITVEGSLDTRTKDGTVTVRAIFRDITERKAAAEQLRHLAYYDPLTGLPNRLLFQDRLTQMLAQAHRSGQTVALLYLDLDRFKEVNDTLGHAAGDQLLKIVAQRLVAALRSSDSVCRLGGDEFTIIAGPTTSQGAAVVARNVVRAISQPMSLLGHEVTVTPSIGIALFPTDGEDVLSLVKHADTAMYRAKTRGNGYQFYEASLQAQTLNRFEIETRLREALDRQELELFYQPQMDVASGRLAGLEAQVRWRHPDGNAILPGEVIGLAEESGLIIPIGEWVLTAACAQVRAWRSAGLDPVRVSVNLSSRQIVQARLSDIVQRALETAGLDPRLLELDFTENVFMHEADAATPVFDRLRDMGVALAINDFGTGYSSLGYLKRFSVGALRIGQGFVRGVTENADDAAIVTAIIAMAQSLGVRVVAEGVERRAQLEWLRARGADVIQGDLVAGAMSADAVAGFLAPGWRFGARRAA